MNTKHEKIEPSLQDADKLKAVEHALALPQAKTFAPPAGRGIHELIAEVREDAADLLRKLELIEQRLVEFDRLQANFYNGRKP